MKKLVMDEYTNERLGSQYKDDTVILESTAILIYPMEKINVYCFSLCCHLMPTEYIISKITIISHH